MHNMYIVVLDIREGCLSPNPHECAIDGVPAVFRTLAPYFILLPEE